LAWRVRAVPGGDEVNAAVVRIWVQIGKQSRGDPFGGALVCPQPPVAVDGAGLTVMVSVTLREVLHATTDSRDLRVATEYQGPVDAFKGPPSVVADLDVAHYRQLPAFMPRP